MPLPLLAIGAGLSALGAIGKFASGNKQMKEAKKINPIWQQYQSSPFAAKQLGLANQLFNGRMAGAPQMERNILSSQGNVLNSVNKNATDASQALAFAAATQGQTDQSLSNLQGQEAQNKMGLLDNLNNAYSQMVGEGDKVYNSVLQKYQLDSQRKDALMSAGAQNKHGAVSDFSSMLMMGGMLGLGGGGGGQTNRSVMNGLNSNGVSGNGVGAQGIMGNGGFGVGNLPMGSYRPMAFPRPLIPYQAPQRNFSFNG